MNYNNNLANDIWFGEPKIEIGRSSKDMISSSSTNVERALAICEGLKIGDFSLKRDLISLLNTAKEDNVMNLCIRLFASTASHADLANVNNLNFLSFCNESSIETFVSCANDTMSVQVIPYLLSILEEWDDTDVGVSIRDVLDDYFGIYKELGEECDLPDIGDYCSSIIKTIDSELYYYQGVPAFPGDLAKKILQLAIVSLRNADSLKTSTIPSLLSTWSGKKCPVDYNTIVTDGIYRKLVQYVDELSRLKWIKGKKYFYGHEIK